jgi:SIR2-like domain
MIEPRTSLAMAMHANPGVYALLLGSGVSRSAKIPTGWDVVLQLIQRIAVASGEDSGPDPEAWYRDKYGVEPTYSGLLEAAGKSQSERSRLLKGYFEPSEEELEDGDKQPTKAHYAIARLVKHGTIRVILTTNFDRLMERALEAEGIPPTVISTPEAIEGASPLAHSDCTLVKLHGDYMDLRTKNTPAELAEYDKRLDRLLGRVLDEYGLVICGWSGDWDEALRKAVERRKNRRFTTWWATLGEPSERGKGLIGHCQAQVVPIRGADEFFEDLSERVVALDECERSHPVSAKIAVALTKKYLAEPKHRIQLHDLLMGEIEKIVGGITSDKYPVTGQFSKDDYAQRIRSFDALTEIAAHIVATGCFWDGEGSHTATWVRALIRLGNLTGDSAGDVLMQGLARHPARILLYAAGIAHSAEERYSPVHSLLAESKVREYRDEDEALAIALVNNQWWPEAFKRMPGFENKKVPVSEHVFRVLRPVFAELLPDKLEFTHAFDRFEVLQAFYCGDRAGHAPRSAFMYRTSNKSPLTHLLREVQEESEKSRFLKAGFCGGSEERFTEVKERVLQTKNRVEFS